jgi:predicted metal-binding membrane protein
VARPLPEGAQRDGRLVATARRVRRALSMPPEHVHGETGLEAAVSFVAMWVVMMVPMMLPSLIPMLRRYRHAVTRTSDTRLARLTAVVSTGYFSVWAAFGIVAFILDGALAWVRPALADVLPIAIGVVIATAGAMQFTGWKRRQLACCREAPGARVLEGDAGTAWRHGLRLGLHCSYSCAGAMAILLVVGMMDLRAMALVTLAITVERLAPAGERVARGIGAAVVCGGLLLIVGATR